MNTFSLTQSGFHALERLVAAESWEIGGALGVAADPYPHQIENLRRILADTEVRHLLADEVGMGKTVQALMILNILRKRDPSLRVAIVAPERICYQWQVELSARGHVRANILSDEAEPDEHPDGEGHVHLIKSEMIRRQPARPSPEDYDMLIVDEVHAINLTDVAFLSSLCQERRDAPRFRHVLFLTATPRLGNADWARAVLGAIEPERSAIAALLNQEPLDFLASEAERGDEQVASGTLSPSAHATAHALNRRILRQTRNEWPGIAPMRKVRTVRTEPSDAEVAKLALQNAACRSGGDSPLDRAPWIQCRQIFRSSDSLRPILRHQTFSAHPDLRDQVNSTMSRNPGDALFDDLCDVLLEFWKFDPERAVIIVAGDTPTVDMLQKRLVEMFPHLAEDGIATMRGRYNTDLLDVVEAVESDATVLIMEEFVEAGLNLHHVASDMIFYNLPWQAARIDQLIGRLDRLRSNGLVSYMKDTGVGMIGLWRMVVAGSADERVLEALDLLEVFEHPLPYLDEALSQRIDSIMTQAAAGRPEFRQAAMDLKEELSFGLAQSSTASCSDGTDSQAETGRLHRRIRSLERAGQDWLRLMLVTKMFAGGFPRTSDKERVTLLELPRTAETCPYRPAAMTTRQPEVLRVHRDKLGRPPRKDVLLPGDQLGKHARFFSTGDELHDDLVSQAIDVARSEKMTFKPVGIFLPDEPPLTGLIGKTILLVRSAWRLSGVIDRHFNMKVSDATAVRIGQQADRRWLSTLYPDQLRTACLVISEDGTVEPPPDGTEQMLLSGDCRPTTNPKQQQIIPVSRFARAILDDLKREWRQQERQRISALRDQSRPAFENRRHILMSETETYVRWKQLGIKDLQSRNIKDPQQKRLNAGQIAAEQRRMELRIAGMNDRLRAMEDVFSKLTEPAEMESLIMLAKVLPPPNRIL